MSGQSFEYTRVNTNTVIVGHQKSGKSALLWNLLGLPFTDIYQETIPVEFEQRRFDDDGKNIKQQIWDTSGNARLITKFLPQTYQKADTIILTVDLSVASGITDAEVFLNDYISQYAKPDVRIIIAGTKADLDRKISPQQFQQFCEKHKKEGIEVSAKNGTNVQTLFKLARHPQAQQNIPNVILAPNAAAVETVSTNTSITAPSAQTNQQQVIDQTTIPRQPSNINAQQVTAAHKVTGSDNNQPKTDVRINLELLEKLEKYVAKFEIKNTEGVVTGTNFSASAKPFNWTQSYLQTRQEASRKKNYELAKKLIEELTTAGFEKTGELVKKTDNAGKTYYEIDPNEAQANSELKKTPKHSFKPKTVDQILKQHLGHRIGSKLYSEKNGLFSRNINSKELNAAIHQALKDSEIRIKAEKRQRKKSPT